MSTEVRSYGYWRAIVVGSASAFALATGPAAIAQQAAPATAAAAPKDQLEEVIVTGFRASLQSALDKKRASNQIIESIAPEDIGKMPDQNVAEALQRLPGISINRSGGKGTQVLIRGLANNLVTLNGDVLLTGREIYASGEGSGGGGNIQYASLEGIPSEEIGGINVIKTPNARDREGGLGGQVDLRTRSPLAQDMGFNLGGNARATKATDAEGGATPQVTLVGGFKFNDNFAITGSVSYDDQKTHDKQYQAQNRNQWRTTNTATDGSYVGSPVAGVNSTLPQVYIDPQMGYFSDILQQVKTKGATLGAEWNWTDDIKSTFNWFYVREEDVGTTYSNKGWFTGGAGGADIPGLFPGIDPTQSYAIDGHGVVQHATFMANGAETATLFESNKTQANNFQFDTTFGGSGPVTGDFGLSYAKATGDYEAAQADVEHGFYGAFGSSSPSVQMTAPGCNNGGNSCTNGNHGYAWVYSNGGTSGLPTGMYPNNYGYTDVLSNPAYTLFKSNWAWANKVDENNFAVKFDLKTRVLDMIDLTGGARYATRTVDYTHGRYLIDGSGSYGVGGVGAGTPAGNCCTNSPTTGTWIYFSDPGYATIPYDTPQTNAALVKYYNNFANGLISVKDPVAGGMTNPATYLNTLWTQAGVPNNTETFFKDKLNSYKVKEKTTAVYIMGDAGSDAYHANFGVRVLKTTLTVDGGQTNAAGATYYGTASWNGLNSNDVSFSTSRSYTDVLPSFNFTLNMSDTQKLRFAAARVVSPQNLNDIGKGNAYDFTRTTDGPNGQIRFRFDGGNSGNPKLDPFRASQFDFAWEDFIGDGGLISAGYFYKAVDNFVTTAQVPTLVNDDLGGSVANVSSLVNGGTGKIYGVELIAQYAFRNGLGFAANYTKSNSESSQNNTFDKNVPIPGVSKDALNGTIYFERSGFTARASYSWRSKAVNSSGVGSSFSFNGADGAPVTYTVYSAAYGQLDGQLGYDFSRHFGVLLSAENLTNSKQHTYLQYPNQPFTYDDTGRRLFFGVKARL